MSDRNNYLTDEQISDIIDGLRALQREYTGYDNAALDALCERLNCAGAVIIEEAK